MTYQTTARTWRLIFFTGSNEFVLYKTCRNKSIVTLMVVLLSLGLSLANLCFFKK